MERYSENAMSILDELHTERLDYDSEYVPLADALNHLAAYEDTGFTPEEIDAIAGLASQNCAKAADSVDRLLSDDTELEAYRAALSLERALELGKADKDGRVVVLPEPRKPLVWDDDRDALRCPECGRDLMGNPYEDRTLIQCPQCGQYVDETKASRVWAVQRTGASVKGGRKFDQSGKEGVSGALPGCAAGDLPAARGNPAVGCHCLRGRTADHGDARGRRA